MPPVLPGLNFFLKMSENTEELKEGTTPEETPDKTEAKTKAKPGRKPGTKTKSKEEPTKEQEAPKVEGLEEAGEELTAEEIVEKQTREVREKHIEGFELSKSTTHKVDPETKAATPYKIAFVRMNKDSTASGYYFGSQQIMITQNAKGANMVWAVYNNAVLQRAKTQGIVEVLTKEEGLKLWNSPEQVKMRNQVKINMASQMVEQERMASIMQDYFATRATVNA